jgi:hypothetical protein
MFYSVDNPACEKLCYRDIKPANILFRSPNRRRVLQLPTCDFGLANDKQLARTRHGFGIYRARELFLELGFSSFLKGPNTKDECVVYRSLFVTIASTPSTSGFDENARKATVAILKPSPMARQNPELRASATQLLIKLYKGVGFAQSRRMSDSPARPLPACHCLPSNLCRRGK